MAKTPAASQNSLLKRLFGLPMSTVLVVAAALFMISGYLWWNNVYTRPQNVFQAMLNNSLRLQGITRTVAQDGEGQAMNQVTRLSFTPASVAHSTTVLKQGEGTTVVTESVGTPQADFVRYTRIDTDQKDKDGKPLDFSQVLNVWGQSAEVFSGGSTDGELYNESALGIVPFGNLPAGQREELINLINTEEVYEVDYDNVNKSTVSGRPQYIFEVGIDAEAYVKLLKRYGELAGLNNLAALNPDDYAGQPRLPFTVTVDVLSRELVGIENTDTGTRTEVYSGHNVSKVVDVPKEAISVEELQTKLQSIQ